MSEQYKSPSGSPYSAKCWLDNHHSVKSRLRAELVHKLPIMPGSKVLDIGCGTGLWSFLFAERVGHKGAVTGIDQDKEAIAIAERRRSTHHLGGSIRFKCGDALSLDFDEKFDLIIAFNSLSYMSDPRLLLEKVSSYIEPKGTLLIKDSDIGSDFFWPISIDLYHRLMVKINPPSPSLLKKYDPFFARKVPGLLKASNYSNVHAISQSFSFCFPVDHQERKYISANGQMISDLACEIGDIEGSREWASQFDNSNGHCIFDNPNFLYTMTEFLFLAQAPASS